MKILQKGKTQLMSSFSPVIKWSGSKRSQADEIIKYFPEQINTYFEPFLGGGAILYKLNPEISRCCDICKPLINLWQSIKNVPEIVSTRYTYHWEQLQKKGHQYYYHIRELFNKTKKSEYLLFLSRTCVNGLIRFNKTGDFNNSFHHSRPGINPKTLKKIIYNWSKKIQNTVFECADYRSFLDKINEGDFVYLDPPYFYNKGRYLENIDFDDFYKFLNNLNEKNVKYAISLDGFRGSKKYKIDIPVNLYKRHLLINSGNSAFKKVMDKKIEPVKESLYLNY